MELTGFKSQTLKGRHGWPLLFLFPHQIIFQHMTQQSARRLFDAASDLAAECEGSVPEFDPIFRRFLTDLDQYFDLAAFRSSASSSKVQRLENQVRYQKRRRAEAEIELKRQLAPKQETTCTAFQSTILRGAGWDHTKRLERKKLCGCEPEQSEPFLVSMLYISQLMYIYIYRSLSI